MSFAHLAATITNLRVAEFILKTLTSKAPAFPAMCSLPAEPRAVRAVPLPDACETANGAAYSARGSRSPVCLALNLAGKVSTLLIGGR